MIETIDAVRSKHDSTAASALESPRKYQMSTSVSKIKGPASPYLSDVSCRIAHILSILPHAESGVIADLGALSLFRNRHDRGLRLAPIQNGDRLSAVNGAEHVLHPVPEVDNGRFHRKAPDRKCLLGSIHCLRLPPLPETLYDVLIMAKATTPIPPGFHTLTPHLSVDGAAKYIDFLTKAFGATELHRAPGPGGKLMHATVRIGDSMLMFADYFPEFGCPPIAEGNWPVVLSLYVPDADASSAQQAPAVCE